ncbi:MAG: hypothetical protein GYA66_03975, partial [Phyllobacteriaceae bacterium]|nr:hypothetical protein [Phyllobacteriaceae bacterium]
DETHATGENFQRFRKTYDELIEKIAKSKKPSALVQSLFKELADQHPVLAPYLAKLLKRTADFSPSFKA